MLAPTSPPPTRPEDVDAAVSRVARQAHAFAQLPVREKARLVSEVRERFFEVAPASVRAACNAKGIEFESPLAGEEWISGPVITLRALRHLEQTLGQIVRKGNTVLPRDAVGRLPDGRLRVSLAPLDFMDRLEIPRHRGEVHFLPDVSKERLEADRARFYKKPHAGQVWAVLGAGNINSIPPLDLLHALFVEGGVAVLKLNPVNAYLGPFLEEAFRPLVDAGFLAFVYGGADVGERLVQNPAVHAVHITGSAKTYDAMVWGSPGALRETRKREGTPLLQKKVSAELGCVTPLIVVPGPYNTRELAQLAASVAGMLTFNAGYNCNAAKLLVTSQRWEAREHFLELVAEHLSRATVRRAWYPGGKESFRAHTGGVGRTRIFGHAHEGELPFAFVTHLSPDDNASVFSDEPWCGVLSEVALSANGASAFLEAAVAFVNTRVWGNLSCGVMIHERVAKECARQGRYESALRALRYGTVAVNTWPAVGFALSTLPWGAHPTSSPQNIQSGMGYVHNSFMFEGIEKSVLQAPHFHMPLPIWTPGHATLDQVGGHLVALEHRVQLSRLARLLGAAARA
ncbi:MAG: aldehyde dehydrogenase family protein [Myxococcaceae bacterium]